MTAQPGQNSLHYFQDQGYPTELRAVMEICYSVLSNMAAVQPHVALSTPNVTGVIGSRTKNFVNCKTFTLKRPREATTLDSAALGNLITLL